MTNYMHKLSRRVTVLLGAGMLLQAGGCQLDTAALASGVLNAVVQNVIGGYVYGAFDLVG